MSKEIHLIGNAHLDPIWLWRWQEGCGEVMQTFRSALDRLKEYNDFVFTCSSASYYRWVEETDPEMFAEIVKRVKQGRWVPVNGWWVQPDCNIPSGESFARQALYSQLYYYEKFGTICNTGYNVDSFGHNAMLPQLLSKGGMRTYVMMRPDKNENPDIPNGAFWWDSADGSRVLTYKIPTGYGESGTRSLNNAIEMLDKMSKDNGIGMMLFYGVGNHGGGPTRGDIEYLRENLEREGYTPLTFSSPDDYFQSLCAEQLDLPVWKDEFQHHASGCYSATSMVKQLNRKAENWLASAEKWSTIARKVTGMPDCTADFAEAWRDVCFNQFHDILCGCSIREAYDDVRDSMGHAMTIAARAENNAQLRLINRIDTWLDGVSDSVSCNERHHFRNIDYPRPIVVFNPLSWDIETPVRTYHPSAGVKDSDGNTVLFQNVRSSRTNDTHSDTVFLAKVPAMGYAVYWLEHIDFDEYDEDEIRMESDVIACEDTMTVENSKLKVVFNKETGGIDSFVTKVDGAEYAGKNFAVPTIVDNTKPDTWAHNIFKFDTVVDTMKLTSIRLIENGPLRAVVRTVHEYNKSVLTQDFILASDSDVLRSKCKANWGEPLTILKMPFEVDGTDAISTYEIPAGIIKRLCNGEEEPAQNWADVTVTAADGVRRGVSVMSDSKYSFSCPGNTLNITLLRNSIFADHYSYRPDARFDYTDEGINFFEYAVAPHTGEAEKTDIVRKAALFNCRPVTVPSGYHKGDLPLKKSWLTVDAESVNVTAFKFCEDDSGDLIIRCHETNGKEQRAMIKCDIFDAAFYADFGGFEIKTFRIDSEGFVAETDFLEGIPEN